MSPSDPSVRTAGVVSSSRAQLVAAALKGWIAALVDKSRRNNLLYFRPLKAGTFELASPDPAQMERLLQQEEVPLTKLLGTKQDLSRLEAQLDEIRARALSNREERGIETLYLAMGFATWTPTDGGRPPHAPVLLVPISIEPKGRGGSGLQFKRTGDIQPNLVLLHVLETEHRITVSPEDLINAIQGDDEGEKYDLTPVFDVLRRRAKELPGFQIADQLMIGNFAFQKAAMVKDLQKFAEEMPTHDLISAIAGDSDARASVSQRRTAFEPAEIDLTSPDDEFLFLDADSSQQIVIRQALALQDGTIQGPPGTGKSQTIANLIAEFAARGKRVLFVAEKRAALDVVLSRLRDSGLDHLALDLHGAEISRLEVLRSLARSRELLRDTPTIDCADSHAKLAEKRRRLQAHVQQVHGKRVPTQKSVYDMEGRLMKLGPETRTRTRWQEAPLETLKPAVIRRAQDLLVELADRHEYFYETAPSPWNGAHIPDMEAHASITKRVRACRELWSGWLRGLQEAVATAGLRQPETLNDAESVLALLREVNGSLDTYSVSVFMEERLAELVGTLAPAGKSSLDHLWHWCTDSTYRAGLKTLRAHRENPKVPARVLLEEVTQLADQQKRWRQLAPVGVAMKLVPAAVALCEKLGRLKREIAVIGQVLKQPDVSARPLVSLDALLRDLDTDVRGPLEIVRVHEIVARLEDLGVGEFVRELHADRPDSAQFGELLEHAWLRSALDEALRKEPDLIRFRGRSHDRIVQEFRKLDEERIRVAAGRVRREHAQRAVQVIDEYPTQDATIRSEAQKKRSRMTARRLLQEAPEVALALRPCWMLSPLSVSQLLPLRRDLFDMVLFDEASQVLPQDAIPSLIRGAHVVVAGDRHQLPPTTFFLADESLEEESEEAEGASQTKGFESILDQMSALFDPWTLDWHYRSKDENLIAFSNRHIYNDRLVTFPGPGTYRSLEHHLVQQTPTDTEPDSVSQEVRTVVDLVLQHASERSDQSLGVIALGIKHQRRIEAALQDARKDLPELDEFFSEQKPERFFVKNLERVQGDERDAIILSVGYGKDRSGNLPYRFGPLLTEGGERRMNVAVTRARSRMTVVSSFGPADMDPTKSRAKGVEFLRLYLQYAMSGGTDLGTAQEGDVPLNDFEQGIHDALTARGLNLLSQWGASRYRIDLVAQHPSRPGRHVLAIECDGATYHSAQSARDRDRLRQQHLERLGWRFHRIWSTDWFNDREAEIERTLAAFEAALRAVDAEDAGEAPRSRARKQAVVDAVVAPKRHRRPSIPLRGSIDQYSDDELDELIGWLRSDGRPLAESELLELAMTELGFARRGARIVDRLTAAIRRTQGGAGQ